MNSYFQTYNDIGLAQSKLWPKGTVCITIAANIAETGILGFDACFPDSIIGMVVDEKIASSDYVEYLIQYAKKDLQAEGKGSAQDNINLATFKRCEFPFPDLSVQSAMVGKLNELSAQMEKMTELYERKQVLLTELKQSLLQKAFSGQLTVRDADQS